MIENMQQKVKSFWKRPEGITGMVFLIGIIVVVILYANPLLLFITSLLKNLITTILLFLVLGVILYVLFDKRFRALVWYMYKSFMRWITGVFVQIDPIKILESYVDYLKKNLFEMNEHIAKLKGQMQKLKSIIDNNRSEMEAAMQIAEQAKKKNNMEVVAVNTRQYGRLKDANERYNVLLSKMEVLYRVLAKIYKNSGFLIQDTENEVRMKKQEAIAIRQGYSAMKRAMSIISGDPDKKAIFDLAMETIVDDVSNKIGEMERFIELSASFIDSVDLQNAVYEQKGLELLEKLETEGASFLLSENMPGHETTKKDETKEVYVQREEPKSFGEYSDLFK